MEKEIKEFMDWFEENKGEDGDIDTGLLQLRAELLAIRAKNLGLEEAFNMLKKVNE